jgi:hypothetical protein
MTVDPGEAGKTPIRSPMGPRAGPVNVTSRSREPIHLLLLDITNRAFTSIAELVSLSITSYILLELLQ